MAWLKGQHVWQASLVFQLQNLPFMLACQTRRTQTRWPAKPNGLQDPMACKHNWTARSSGIPVPLTCQIPLKARPPDLPDLLIYKVRCPDSLTGMPALGLPATLACKDQWPEMPA
jgi:hypothetical protein